MSNATQSPRFASSDRVRYHGSMLPHLAGRDLVVIAAHVRSGIGDPATDDVCIVCVAGDYRDYRVSSCNLQVMA